MNGQATDSGIRHLAIGVTGHRSYHDPDEVATSIESVLDRLLGANPAITVISGLAEGADRQVADLVMARGGDLEVILPLEPDDYADDFGGDPSRLRFEEMLGRASAVSIVERAPDDRSREAAYELAGRAMVERSDVVIALWDGEPGRGRGGTAEIIQYALDLDVPVEIVLVERPASTPATSTSPATSSGQDASS